MFSEWVCIDDTIGSLYLWSQCVPPASAIWHFIFLFTSEDHQTLFELIHKDKETTIQPTASLLKNVCFEQTSVIDISFVSTKHNTIFEWCDLVKNLYTTVFESSTRFRLILAWVPESSFPSAIKTICLGNIQECVPNNWELHCSLVGSQHHGDHVEANRFVITIMSATIASTTPREITFQHQSNDNSGYSECLSSNLNNHAVLKISIQ